MYIGLAVDKVSGLALTRDTKPQDRDDHGLKYPAVRLAFNVCAIAPSVFLPIAIITGPEDITHDWMYQPYGVIQDSRLLCSADLAWHHLRTAFLSLEWLHFF